MDNTDNKDNIRTDSSSMGLEGIDISGNNQSDGGIIRNKNGTFAEGTAPGPGRTKGKTLKEWRRETLANMTDEERLEFLKGISNETQWKMAEGNPHQDNSTDLGGEITLKISKEIADKYETNTITGADSEKQE